MGAMLCVVRFQVILFDLVRFLMSFGSDEWHPRFIVVWKIVPHGIHPSTDHGAADQKEMLMVLGRDDITTAAHVLRNVSGAYSTKSMAIHAEAWRGELWYPTHRTFYGRIELRVVWLRCRHHVT